MLILILLSQFLFTPVEPCRLVDTRIQTKLTCPPENNGVCTHTISGPYAFLVAGDETREAFKDRSNTGGISFSFVDQGGEPSGCNVPRDARAVALNITVNPVDTHAGHLTSWTFSITGHIPFNQAPIPSEPPLAATLNWPVHTIHSWYNNTVVLALCHEPTAPFNDCNEDILVQSFGSPVKLIVDVYGYFE